MKKLSTLLITLLVGFVLPNVAIADTTMLQQFLEADEPEVVTEGAETKKKVMGNEADGWRGDKNPHSDTRGKGVGGQGNGWGGQKS